MHRSSALGRRERWLATLPALLLAGVALCQIHLVRAERLSPWQGGGFGMFSTTDSLATRHVRVYVRRGAGAEELPLPPQLVREAQRARTLPTARRLEEFGRSVVEASDRPGGAISGAFVEVWRRRFEPEGLEPRPSRLRSVEIPLRRDVR